MVGKGEQETVLASNTSCRSMKQDELTARSEQAKEIILQAVIHGTCCCRGQMLVVVENRSGEINVRKIFGRCIL